MDLGDFGDLGGHRRTWEDLVHLGDLGGARGFH